LKGLPLGKTLSIPHKFNLPDSTPRRKLRIEKLHSTVTYPHIDDVEVVLCYRTYIWGSHCRNSDHLILNHFICKRCAEKSRRGIFIYPDRECFSRAGMV